MDAPEQDNLSSAVESLAEKVIRKRLELPVLLALEMHLPVTSLFHTTGLFIEPFLSPLFGFERYSEWLKLLSERENVLALMDRIRELSGEVH